MDDLVSIVIPCYNASSTIEETIKSVINQSYKKWEAIIVDDCSTDNSAEIIKAFHDDRIRYYKTDSPSGTPALPRNIGIKESKGDYVAFLDSDDLWTPDKLESQLKYIHSNNVSFVYSYYSRFSSNDRVGGVIKSPAIANFDTIKKRDYIPMLTILLKKELLNGIEFEARPKEDYVFLLRLFQKGVVAYNTMENVALYRISNNSRSSDKWSMFKEHYLILLDFGFSPLSSLLYTFTHSLAALLKYSK